MSQPTPYTPNADFSQQEANNASGRSTVNTAALDAEFAAIETTLDQTLANIQLLQRDDGQLKDTIVSVMALDQSVINLMGGWTLKGAWLALTDYAVNHIVSSGEYTYVCNTAHQSGIEFDSQYWLRFGFAGSADAAIAAAQASASAATAATSATTATTRSNAATASATSAATSASNAAAHASTATTKAGEASASATNAANSATKLPNVTAAGANKVVISNDTASAWEYKTYQDLVDEVDTSARGAEQIGYLQAGTGAVATDVQSKLRESVSVKDFGAKGDGVTNDSVAIQSAVIAVTSAGGGNIKFPAGTYLLNSTVNILLSGISLTGDNQQSTCIVNGQANLPAIKFGDGTNTYNRNSISNMVFGQKAGVVAGSGNCGLMVTKCGNFKLENVQVFSFPASLYDGIVFDGVTQSYVSNFGFQSCTNIGWKLRNNTFDIYASNGRSDANSYGFHIRDCQGLYFSNVSAYANSENGFHISTDGANNTRYLFFNNCVADSSGKTNWDVIQLTVGAFTGCWASTQTSQAANPTADGWRLSGGVLSDITFTSCVTLANNRHGIFCEYVTRVSITGCVMGSSYDMTAFGGKGPGNGLGSGAGSGVAIGAFASSVRVSGGTFINNQRYGIEIASGADKIEILGFEGRFNVLGPVLNSANSTAHKCRISNVGGYNPLGYIAPPSVPASGVEVENKTGVDCMVYLTGGTVSDIRVGATGNTAGVLSTTPGSIFVPAGHFIKLAYTVAPAWQWIGS